MAPDQRYCLSCGARRGAPRVAATPPPAQPAQGQPQPQAAATPPVAAAAQPRQADVSPLAAVIGIALLGGMLLIGVLIGRGANDDPPAPVVQVGESASGGGVVASEWPEGTDGFTVQLTTVPKDGATAESVDAAKQQAVDDGAIDAAVLDSDLYSSLPPGNYLVYSGVYTDRKSAETALQGLRQDVPAATVVEVADDDAPSGSSDSSASPDDTVPEITPPTDPATPEADTGAVIPDAGGEPEVSTGGVAEDQQK